MKRILLKSKIHRARVTDRRLDYEGSAAIDTSLLEEVGIIPYEQIHIYNMSNGHRLETYAIPAPAGSGEVCVNGAAARLAEVGDEIIIAAYGLVEEGEAHRPAIVIVDRQNKVVKKV